jgi:protein involved in sex pheromone biosynthesis
MKAALFLIGVSCVLFLAGCASGPDDPDNVQLGPSIKEQRQEARQKEDFARDLPPPR